MKKIMIILTKMIFRKDKFLEEWWKIFKIEKIYNNNSFLVILFKIILIITK